MLLPTAKVDISHIPYTVQIRRIDLFLEPNIEKTRNKLKTAKLQICDINKPHKQMMRALP